MPIALFTLSFAVNLPRNVNQNWDSTNAAANSEFKNAPDSTLFKNSTAVQHVC